MGYKLPFSSLPFLPLSCFFSSRFFSCLVVRHKKKREGVREKKRKEKRKKEGGKKVSKERKKRRKETYLASGASSSPARGQLPSHKGGWFFFLFHKISLALFFCFRQQATRQQVRSYLGLVYYLLSSCLLRTKKQSKIK